jgi:hypothetical protein
MTNDDRKKPYAALSAPFGEDAIERTDGRVTGRGYVLTWAESFATGGHTSMNEADARKGAFKNGLKKSAAMLGCGRPAYEGTLDDDNVRWKCRLPAGWMRGQLSLRRG